MSPELSSLLRHRFGFDSFRAGQEEAIQSLLNKQHTLAIMPTGAGKSLIYQFAALQFEGLTLVISPLIASDAETGGTWAGATETLKNSWVPVFVLDHDHMPEGNKLLLQKGALAFPHPFKDKPAQLPNWMEREAASLPLQQPTQPGLF